MRGRRQLLDHFAKWDRLDEPVALAELIAAVQGLELARDDVVEALGFDEGSYRRTVIHARPHYQALILCWKSGQRSPIHDHRGSSCVVRVIEGLASEIRFVPTACGRLMPVGAQEHAGGAVAVNCGDEIHQMGNFAAPGCDLITLHIYSPPPYRWRFFPLAATTLADHEQLIEKPARTVRVDLGHSDPVPPFGSKTKGGLPWRP